MNVNVRYLKSRHPFDYSQTTDQLFVANWPTGEEVNLLKGMSVRIGVISVGPDHEKTNFV